MVTLLFYGFVFLAVFILCGIGAEKTEKKVFVQLGTISLILTIVTGFLLIVGILENLINSLTL